MTDLAVSVYFSGRLWKFKLGFIPQEVGRKGAGEEKEEGKLF